jgi:hypothetical protein
MTINVRKGSPVITQQFATSAINILGFIKLAIDLQVAGPSATLRTPSLLLLPDKEATPSQTLHGQIVLSRDSVVGVSTRSRLNWRSWLDLISSEDEQIKASGEDSDIHERRKWNNFDYIFPLPLRQKSAIRPISPVVCNK